MSFLLWLYYLITWIKISLSFLSNGWLFWSVNHTSMVWNFELNVFQKDMIFGEISNKLANVLFEQMYIRLLNLVDSHDWQCYNELILLL